MESKPQNVPSRHRQPLVALSASNSLEERARRRSSFAKANETKNPARAGKESPAQKKPRRSASKRVSFGGEQIKLFNHEQEAGAWDDSSPSQNPLNPSPSLHNQQGTLLGLRSSASASLAQSCTSPSVSPVRSLPGGHPLPTQPTAADSPGEHEETISLPTAATMLRNQQRDQSEPGAPTSSPTLSPQVQLSPASMFMDEDVSFGAAAPRLSAHGGAGADDTTICVQIPSPAMVVKENRRDSIQSSTSEGDITHQMPGMDDLIDQDEEYEPKEEKTNNPIPSTIQVIHEPGLSSAMDDTSFSVGDVTSEAPPLASLLAADNLSTQDRQSNEEQVEYPTPSSSPGNEGRQSIGDITLGMPSLEALADSDEPIGSASKQFPGQQHLEGPKPVAPSAATKGPLQLSRPVLPESRELFPAEGNGDEDTTIHYHEAEGESKTRPGEEQLCAATTAANTVSQATAPTEVVSLETEPQKNRTEVIPSRAPVVTVEKMWDVLGLVFRDKEFKRCVSLGHSLRGETDREESLESNDITRERSTFVNIHAAVRAAGILEMLEASVAQMLKEVAKRQARIMELTRAIEQSPPKYFSRVVGSEKLKPSELSKTQLIFKRLQKVAAKQAAREHASLRHDREAKINTLQEQCVTSLSAVHEATASHFQCLQGAMKGINEKVSENTMHFNVDQVASSRVDPAITGILRSEVTSHVAALERESKNVATALAKKPGMGTEIDALTADNEDLVAEVRRIREFARASSRADLVKLVAQNRDSHLLLSAITGVVPLSVTSDGVHIQVLGAIDVRFEFQATAVKAFNCSVCCESLRWKRDTPFYQFLDQSANLVAREYLSNVREVEDIPGSIQRLVMFFTEILKVDHSLRRYTVDSEACFVEMPNSSSQAAEVRIKAEYFSVADPCKFDVWLSLRANAPNWNSAPVRNQVAAQVESIVGIVGRTPLKDEIQRLVAHSTDGTSRYPFRDALQRIWGLLGTGADYSESP